MHKKRSYKAPKLQLLENIASIAAKRGEFLSHNFSTFGGFY